MAIASENRVHSGHRGLQRRVLSSQKKSSLHVRVQVLAERSLVSRSSVSWKENGKCVSVCVRERGVEIEWTLHAVHAKTN